MERRASQGDLCSQPGSGTERDCHADHQREIFMEPPAQPRLPKKQSRPVTATSKVPQPFPTL